MAEAAASYPPARAPARGPAGWLEPGTAVLAVIAVLGLLTLGRAFFIPLVASITLAAMLDPVRRRLTCWLRSGVLASLVAVLVAQPG